MTKPTPNPWTRECAEVRGPDGVAVCLVNYNHDEPRTLHEPNARLIVASCNAIQSAAEKLGRDPVELAEDLQGKLAPIIKLSERLAEMPRPDELDSPIPRAALVVRLDELIWEARGALAEDK